MVSLRGRRRGPEPGCAGPQGRIGVKFKRAEFRSLESHANEGHMNSW
jgi:hypothetical protein